MNCSFDVSAWPPTCRCCGRKVKTHVYPITAACRGNCGKGLGDHLADGLAAVGITKERVSRLLGRPCGCKERQRRLNELGRKAAAAIRKATGQERHADGEKLDDPPA